MVSLAFAAPPITSAQNYNGPGRGFYVENVVIQNGCKQPVYFRQGGSRAKLEPGTSTKWDKANPLHITGGMSNGKLDGAVGNKFSFSYNSDAGHDVDGSCSVPGTSNYIEWAGPLHRGVVFDQWIQQENFNFKSQTGIIGMNVEFGAFKDELLKEPDDNCDDGLVRTTYDMNDCASIGDTELVQMDYGHRRLDDTLETPSRLLLDSPRELEELDESSHWYFCRSKLGCQGSNNPPTEDQMAACTSAYSKYVDAHTQMYDYKDQTWHNQPVSSGVCGTDGAPQACQRKYAPNFECFEEPCLHNPQHCKAKGYATSGTVGFMSCKTRAARSASRRSE